MMNLSDIVIILCRTSEPGNVGAVCRVMKNMGLSQLRMVAPEALDEERLLARSVHAEDIWRKARFFDTLASASADCSLVVGTTRRRGKKRKNVTLEPRALTEWLVKNHRSAPVALVFGNERTGLDDDELSFCNVASHIPVSEAFPSLNLSHAVQVYAYELFLAFGTASNDLVKGEWIPLKRPAVDELTADITGTLAGLGFYRKPGREEQTRFLRDLICRAGLTEREGRYLRDIFVKAAWLGTYRT
ncbi:MAG: RNA methyltransferase [Treponema sp.]|jgi:tRNA/rRNA methyltransferase/tRNA (cytidine32/uridine32-2'-O)-methyltransferase|nr:RNA methyltransferase [Treponema sp.]